MKTVSAILGFFGILAFCEAGYSVLESPMTSLILMLLGLIVMIPTMLISKEIRVRIVLAQFVTGVVTFLAINSSVAIAEEIPQLSSQQFVRDQFCGSTVLNLYDDEYHHTWVKIQNQCHSDVKLIGDPVTFKEGKTLCRKYKNLRLIINTKETDLCDLFLKN